MDTGKVSRIDRDTLGLVQSVFENCRYLCRQMGQCSRGHRLCGKNGDSPPALLEDFSQICDASMMKSRLEQSVRLVAAQTLQGLLNMEEPAHRLATIIREEINHLNKLMDGILHIAKPKQPKLKVYDINEIVDRIMPVIKGKIGDNGNNIAVRWDRSQDRAIALVDDDQIQEAFMNLATNALEAMLNGELYPFLWR